MDSDSKEIHDWIIVRAPKTAIMTHAVAANQLLACHAEESGHIQRNRLMLHC